MSEKRPDEWAARAATHDLIILQDHKRLPARFFLALFGARLGRLS